MNNALHNNDCPPLMSDGRIATDYRPSCVTQVLINNQNNLMNSHQSRAFMQENAEKLMAMNRDYFQSQFECPSGGKYFHVDPNEHDIYWKKYKQTLTKKTPTLKNL